MEPGDIRISVITPVFNAERHLAALIASLSSQTEASLQIILVDDGSTDASLAMAREAAANDPRIEVLAQPNRGVSAARNAGLARARGHWIAFADSDDWLHPDTLRTWCAQAEAQALEVLVGNGFLFNADADPETGADPRCRPKLLHRQPWGTVLNGAVWMARSIAAREWPHQVWLQLARRDFLERTRLRFVEGVVHEDVLWTMHLGLAAERIGFADAALYGWRANPASITRDMGAVMSAHRAQSYLAVLGEIALMADAQADAVLRRALLRHVNHQASHLVGLMRRHLDDSALRRSIARSFVDRGLMRAMFGGCADVADLWRALRCGWALRRFAR